MHRFIYILSIYLPFVLFTSCSNDDESIPVNEDDFLIFGHFYGFCSGEDCIETFKLENGRLFEADNDLYAGNNDFYDSSFTELSADLYEETKDLLTLFPSALFDESDTTFGCPDCADGGGLFIERKIEDQHDFWIIDQIQDDVPAYMHDLMDAVNAKIGLINN